MAKNIYGPAKATFISHNFSLEWKSLHIGTLENIFIALSWPIIFLPIKWPKIFMALPWPKIFIALLWPKVPLVPITINTYALFKMTTKILENADNKSKA